MASVGFALNLCTALPEKSQLKAPVIAAVAAEGPGADDVAHSVAHAGSGGGALCFGSICAASAEGIDVALLPVTALTPLHPDIDLDVRLDYDGGGSSRGVLQLSSVTLGKGAFGRVVAGTYGGLRVAVKIIDHGLTNQWPGAPLPPPPTAAPGNNAAEDLREMAVNNKEDNHLQEGGGAAGSPVGEVIAADADADADAGATRRPRKLMHVVDAAAPSSSPGNAKFEDLFSPHLRSSAGAAIAGGGEGDEVPTGRPSFGGSCRGPLELSADEVSSGPVVVHLRTTTDCLLAEGNDIGGESYPLGQPRCCYGCGVDKSLEGSGVVDTSNETAAAAAAGVSATAAVALCGALVPPVDDSVAGAGATMLPLPPALPVAAVAANLAVVKCLPALSAASNPAVSASVISPSHTQFSTFSIRDPEIAGAGGGGRTSTKPSDSQAALLPIPKQQHGSRLVGTPAATATAALAPVAVAVEAQAAPPARPAVTKRELTLKQEVEVLARCQHPNVVRLLAACLRPPRFCLVMELMETSLDRLLYSTGRQHKLLPLDTVLHIAIQIAKGLAYLHPTIVHRDLKPGNVLISHSDAPRRLTVKLADFGLSRLRDTVLVTEHPEVGTVSGCYHHHH
ncbi:hypothetical protein Vafri_12125 [Volvox africanus]|uniref:Protein kinase domain-containing protein n=1 Tax=Volvox africanus TaxID=51714 RepID=A0A8J4B9H6_9CHLO|nr:hypothetical protein Vafri_12125 [Volvox africanus]